MGYYSGTANSLTALRTALLTHAQADGWALSGNVLSKSGVYFEITDDASHMSCLGCESNAVANPAPCAVKIGTIYQLSGYATRLISFPCNYEVFGFSDELYLIVNYDVDSFQWMAFGKSSVPGLPGQGGWCGASIGGAAATYLSNGSGAPIYLALDSISNLAAAGNFGSTCAMLFSNQYPVGNYPDASFNSHVNSGLDGHGWLPSAANTAGQIGALSIAELLFMQPSGWNTEAALLPIRAWKMRSSYKVSLTVDLAHARHLRIDNLTPGDILTIGADKWKVFPWYRKDLSSRNGGRAVNHTGTFGWAIRYEGP